MKTALFYATKYGRRTDQFVPNQQYRDRRRKTDLLEKMEKTDRTFGEDRQNLVSTNHPSSRHTDIYVCIHKHICMYAYI